MLDDQISILSHKLFLALNLCIIGCCCLSNCVKAKMYNLLNVF